MARVTPQSCLSQAIKFKLKFETENLICKGVLIEIGGSIQIVYKTHPEGSNKIQVAIGTQQQQKK